MIEGVKITDSIDSIESIEDSSVPSSDLGCGIIIDCSPPADSPLSGEIVASLAKFMGCKWEVAR